LCIIFVGVGIAEVHEETIAQKFSDVPVISLDDFSTNRLISMDNFPVLFRIELGREFRGVHEITENHGQLPSFRVRRGCSRERFNRV
jgi:hypothetical protein